MKPTKTQKEVIDTIIGTLMFWRTVDNIDSPFIYNDMDEAYRDSLEDCLSQEEIEELKAETCNLFQFIKNLAV